MVVQIMIGLINLGFGVPLYHSTSRLLALDFWVPWWAGLLYVISGSLTMLRVDAPGPRVRTLASCSNAISAAVAVFAAVIYVLSTLIDKHGRSLHVTQVPHLLLVMLFLYSIVEFVFALVVTIVLFKM
ncbi:membrane-spanning 4-domains subfamily A member 15-like [Mobula hypostoma]|uniref:membrane-spanning 4-domains subfamily A member 15-like n=1 Tax=Mobula hypostoma TaxID=723540 RepID=UPI002FC322B4